VLGHGHPPRGIAAIDDMKPPPVLRSSGSTQLTYYDTYAPQPPIMMRSNFRTAKLSY
jgi:hypothetical protein